MRTLVIDVNTSSEWEARIVHGDVHKLLNIGLLNRTADGQIEFPYDDVHLDVHMRAA